MNITKKIYVIAWRYLDGSGYGIVGAYSTNEHAVRICDLLTKYGCPQYFWVEEVVLETEA